MIRLISLALLLSCCIAGAQILWKISVMGQPELFASGIVTKAVLKHFLTSWSFFGGALLYVVGTVFWLYLLNSNDVSYIYPLLGLTFILALLGSRFILHESVSLTQWVGAFVIVFGVALIIRR